MLDTPQIHFSFTIDLTHSNIKPQNYYSFMCNVFRDDIEKNEYSYFNYFQKMILMGNYTEVLKLLRFGGNIKIKSSQYTVRLIDEVDHCETKKEIQHNVFDLCDPFEIFPLSIPEEFQRELNKNKFLIFKELIKYFKILKFCNELTPNPKELELISKSLLENQDKFLESFKKVKMNFLRFAKFNPALINPSEVLEVNLDDFAPSQSIFNELIKNPYEYLFHANYKKYLLGIELRRKITTLKTADEESASLEILSEDLFDIFFYRNYDDFKFLLLRIDHGQSILFDSIEKFLSYDYHECLDSKYFTVNSYNIFNAELDPNSFLPQSLFDDENKKNLLNILFYTNNFVAINILIDLFPSLNYIEYNGLTTFEKILNGALNYADDHEEKIKTFHNLLFFGQFINYNATGVDFDESLMPAINKFLEPISEESISKFHLMKNTLNDFYEELKKCIDKDFGEGTDDFFKLMKDLAKIYVASKPLGYADDFEGAIEQREIMFKKHQDKFYETSYNKFFHLDFKHKVALSLNFMGFIRYMDDLKIYHYLFLNVHRKPEYKEFISYCDELINLFPRNSDVKIMREEIYKKTTEELERKKIENKIKNVKTKIKKAEARFKSLVDDIDKKISDEIDKCEHDLNEVLQNMVQETKKLFDKEIDKYEEDFREILHNMANETDELIRKKTKEVLKTLAKIHDDITKDSEYELSSKDSQTQTQITESIDKEDKAEYDVGNHKVDAVESVSKAEPEASILTKCDQETQVCDVQNLQDKITFWHELLQIRIPHNDFTIIDLLRSNEELQENLLFKDILGFVALNYAFAFANAKFFKEFISLYQELSKNIKDLDLTKIFFDKEINANYNLNCLIFDQVVNESEKIEKLNIMLSFLNKDQGLTILNCLSHEVGTTPLISCIETNQYDLAIQMIKYGVDLKINDENDSILLKLLHTNNLNFLEQLNKDNLINYSEITSEFYINLKQICEADNQINSTEPKSIAKKIHDNNFIKIIYEGIIRYKSRIDSMPIATTPSEETLPRSENTKHRASYRGRRGSGRG